MRTNRATSDPERNVMPAHKTPTNPYAVCWSVADASFAVPREVDSDWSVIAGVTAGSLGAIDRNVGHRV